MAHILHLAPAGTGKTERLLELLRELAQAERTALPKAWVLLATRRQELNFRQKLIQSDQQIPVYFNIDFFNFYSLNARLLKAARTPARRLNSLTRYGLLRQLLGEMLAEGQLAYFRRIADTRGFASILAELIDELKQAGVDVADFAAAARSEKDNEIAQIYRRYQDLLRQSDLADVEGEGWLALAKLQERCEIASGVDLLLVDGYDQFTIVQARLLATLARAIQNIHITLTDIPSARAEALPHRSVRARFSLQQAFQEAGVRLLLERMEKVAGEREADLERLGERVFSGSPAAAKGDAIRMLALPNPAEEVKTVLRKIKRQLLDGVQPDDILVALRDWSRYAAHFETGADEYDLPLLLHYERELTAAPVIAVLIDLLGMAPRFRRRALLDTLRSPYIDAGLDADLIDLLDRITIERQFLGGGTSDWLETISLAGRPDPRDRDDLQFTVLTAPQREALISRLSAFFHGLTPPERAPLAAYASWLENLLGGEPLFESAGASSPIARNSFTLNIIERTKPNEETSAEITRRDTAALAGLKHVLRDLAASDDVLRASIGGASEVDWRRFWSDFKQALETAKADPFDRSRAGHVLVTTAAEARGLPHRHVYILGLSEGLFPAEITEDPLFLDSEREDLQARGIPLATQAERIDDQGLFYELISLPRETLTLSRPSFLAGKTWLESHLWRAVKRVYPQLEVETAAVGSVVKAAQSASDAETLLSVAAQLNGNDAIKAAPALRIKNWLQLDDARAAQWRRIETGRQVELGRLSNAPFDRFSGILAAPALLREITRRLGNDHIWSASQLKDYGLCGFRFFAKRLLKLEETAEPEAGFDAAQLGSLNHRILEETYREIRQRGLRIDEGNLQAALNIFAQAADDILERAPALFNFRATATWQEEKQVLRNRLVALVKQDFSPDSPLNRFGEARYAHDLELRLKHAEIELAPEDPPLRIAGFIDRVDRVDGALVVIDYKSGTTAIERREMEIGRDYQMLIYMLALRSLLKRFGHEDEVAGGLFWHLRNLRASGICVVDDEDDEAALEMARQHVARNVKQSRRGQFPVLATAMEGGKCSRYCEFSHLCRMRVTSRHKPVLPA